MSDTAILLMGHGSRVPGAGENMERVAQRLRERGEHSTVEVCYMELQEPRFEDVFHRCLERGVTRMLVMPYLLNAGLHLRSDIPGLLQRIAHDHPEVTLILGKHLGFDDLLVELVKKRVGESQDLEDVRMLKVEPREKLVPEGGHDHHHHHHH